MNEDHYEKAGNAICRACGEDVQLFRSWRRLTPSRVEYGARILAPHTNPATQRNCEGGLTRDWREHDEESFP